MRNLVAAQMRGVGWVVSSREERRERRSPRTREWEVVEVLDRDTGSREKMTEGTISVELVVIISKLSWLCCCS